jgi:cytoskeletal protein RodZ
METLGQFLKEQRLKRTITLDEIARTTKIRKGLLEALEQDNYDLLPPRSYVRGMVKLYAQEVGIDINEVLEKFEKAPIEAGKLQSTVKIKHRMSSASPGTYLMLIIIGIGLLGYFMYARSDKQEITSVVVSTPPESNLTPTIPTTIIVSTAPVSSTAVTTEPINNPPSGFIASVATEAVTPTAQTSREKPSLDDRPFTVRFEAHERTWMRIQADEKKSVHILLNPGESYAVTADNTVSVRLGNAGGVSLFLNDIPLAKAGKSGEVVNLEFPKAAQYLVHSQ